MIEKILRDKIIDVGEVRIAKSSLGRKRPGSRYVIYLPLNRNYIWEELHKANRKFKVFIELPPNV
jgi:hypothetical protein